MTKWRPPGLPSSALSLAPGALPVRVPGSQWHVLEEDEDRHQGRDPSYSRGDGQDLPPSSRESHRASFQSSICFLAALTVGKDSISSP